MGKKAEIIGQKFNYGTVVEELGLDDRRRNVLWKVKCDCGNYYKATSTELINSGRKSCGCSRYKEVRKRDDALGKRYGKLIVLDTDTKKKNSSGSVYLKCLCDCGKEKYITYGNLKAGNVKSCGCNKNKRGQDHPLFKGYKDISLSYWNRVERNAKERGVIFDLTIKEAWKIYDKQDKKCALSGVDISILQSKGIKNRNHASLDRIDSSKGYFIGNVQWVHKDVNKMKSDFENKYFIEVCKRISSKNDEGS